MEQVASSRDVEQRWLSWTFGIRKAQVLVGPARGDAPPGRAVEKAQLE
jgi:hypothetical protein